MADNDQWYTKPEHQTLLAAEKQAMLPFVGKIVPGVNFGRLADGRLFWRVKQRIKQQQKDGTVLYDRVYDILLVYQKNHPAPAYGTSVRSYLMAPYDLNWLQLRALRTIKNPKLRSIPHVLSDGSLCNSSPGDFDTRTDGKKGVATAKTALLTTVKWLHACELGFLSEKAWEDFHKHGVL